jgi:hypothetical protein
VAGPTGGRLVAHIFTADRGDHYRINDDLPQAAGRACVRAKGLAAGRGGVV